MKSEAAPAATCDALKLQSACVAAPPIRSLTSLGVKILNRLPLVFHSKCHFVPFAISINNSPPFVLHQNETLLNSTKKINK